MATLLNKLDEQIYFIFKREYGREPDVTDEMVASQIKQSILKAIMEKLPTLPKGHEGMTYDERSFYGSCREEFESVIKDLLK